MATVYSLVVWGGRSGVAAASISVSGATFTMSNHGLSSYTASKPNSCKLRFIGGTPPGNATANITYYVKYIAWNQFELYTNSNLSTGKLTTSSSGSGWTLQSDYMRTVVDATRYGGGTATDYSGARIYASIAAFNTGRSGASATNSEICELAERMQETPSAKMSITVPAAETIITSSVDGVRSDAFHNGGTSGYVVYSGFGYDAVIALDGFRTTLDGIQVCLSQTYAYGIYDNKVYNTIKNCIIVNYSAVSGQVGIRLYGHAATVVNNLIYGLYGDGITLQDYAGYGTLIANNTVVKCVGSGFVMYGTGNTHRGWVYNNISVGNSTNWSGSASTEFHGAGYNGGVSGNTPWYRGTDTGIKTLTASDTTFVSYSGNNFALAGDSVAHTSSSAAVDAGIAPVGIDAVDMLGFDRPAYKNGSAEVWDIGAFEFNWGYTRPLVRTIDFSGLVSGSQVVIYTTNTTTELASNRSDTSPTTYTYDAAASGVTVDYTVLKAGYAPIRVTGVALTATSTPVAVQQQLDRAYATPSGLTFGTNAIVNVTSRVVTSLQVTASTTVQNWYSTLMDAWIDSATNTTLKNCAFPVIPFGEASFTVLNGIEFSDGATSIAFFKRDGLRYSSDAGTTITAIWAAILTLDTPAGTQIKYRQAPAGTITNAANTGPMDQLVQVLSDPNGDGTYTDGFDYRGHMVLRAPNPGYSQPMPDLVATYGNLVDGLFVAAMAPVLQYATTNADIDAAHLALDNTAKTYTITAAHTMLELYQRAQWWANQDAQWDADIPLITTDGSTFTQPSTWSMTGVSYLTAGTLSGGSATLAAGTQGIAYNGVTMNLGAAGTYTFTMAGSCTVKVTPTSPSTYVFGSGSFNGTLTVNNMAAHAITIEIPAGVTTSTTGNTGGAITFVAPVIYSDISITSMTNAVGASRRLQIANTTAVSAAARANSTAYVLGDIRLRQTGIGTENTAGLYLRCTTAGTSAGSPPTWNTTPGGTTTDGTAVWTTYKVLYYDADPAATSLTDTYIDGEEFLAGETINITFAEMDAGTSFKTYSAAAIATAAGFSALVAEAADEIYATFALNGSSYESTFSPNYVADYLVLDSNTDFSGKAAFAYFCYLLTSSQGMYEFWGGMTAIDAGNIRINNSVLNMYFDESAGFVKQTDDVRIFRADGTRPALDPTTGGNGIEINWRTPVNVVTTGGSALTPTESAALMALPSAATNATTVWSNATRTLTGSGVTAQDKTDVAAAVRTNLALELARLLDLAKINGLVPGTDAVVTATTRTAGDVAQSIAEAGGTVTVSRA